MVLSPGAGIASAAGKKETKGFLMQGASPLAFPGLDGARHGLNLRSRHPSGAYPRRWRLDQPLRCLTEACLLCRLPTLPLVYFVSPYPLPPSPAGKGETKVISCKGLGGARHGLNLRSKHPTGAYPPALVARPAIAVPDGGLPCWSPANPAFSLLFCPHPPAPRSQSALPGGKGETISLFRRGLRPRHPGTYLLTALTDHAEQAPGAGEPKV